MSKSDLYVQAEKVWPTQPIFFSVVLNQVTSASDLEPILYKNCCMSTKVLWNCSLTAFFFFNIQHHLNNLEFKAFYQLAQCVLPDLFSTPSANHSVVKLNFLLLPKKILVFSLSAKNSPFPCSHLILPVQTKPEVFHLSLLRIMTAFTVLFSTLWLYVSDLFLPPSPLKTEMC